MKTGQGFLLVFSITSLTSLTELAELREQIIRIKDDENVPIVIVGNKSDLEDDRMVSRARAFAVSQSWGNAPYYETSARRRGEHIALLFLVPLYNCHQNRPADACAHKKPTWTRFSWIYVGRLFGGIIVLCRTQGMS